MNLLYILKKDRNWLQCSNCNITRYRKYIECKKVCNKDCYDVLAKVIKKPRH